MDFSLFRFQTDLFSRGKRNETKEEEKKTRGRKISLFFSLPEFEQVGLNQEITVSIGAKICKAVQLKSIDRSKLLWASRYDARLIFKTSRLDF